MAQICMQPGHEKSLTAFVGTGGVFGYQTPLDSHVSCVSKTKQVRIIDQDVP